ncbi:TPA: DUF2523 domain-containing protein [Salmonella enterica]|uniref:DUF2523 domain-containing protein n=1 Tax=Salmonella enterica TaxID=28901 RepID=A0A743NWN6_SALER|nr:DUF2523 domain-containing protein [Salmonella enterica]
MPLLVIALGQMLVFIFRQIVVKFVLFTALYLLLTQLAPLLTSFLPDGRNISQLFAGLPSTVIWCLNLIAFDVTFPMIIAAHFLRFFIRRIPFLG